jgi:hypothetical protein
MTISAKAKTPRDLQQEHMQKARGVFADIQVATAIPDTLAIIASALSEAYRSGVEAERERAAKWHDTEAAMLQQYEDAVRKGGGFPDTNGRLRKIEWHKRAAAAIRKA